MTETEAVRRIKHRKSVPFLKTAGESALCALAGFLFTISGINGSFSPFGVAFASSLPEKFTVPAAAGVIVGSFISFESVGALRYTASVLALCVILLSLKAFNNVRSHPAVPSVSSFVCLLVTGLAAVFAGERDIASFLICFSEACVGAASAFLFLKCRGALTVKGRFSVMTSKEATAIVLTVTVLLMSLKNLSFGNFVPVRIVFGVLILLCAFYSREAGGAVVGVCSGLTMSLGSGDVLLLAFYAFGGLMAGVFSTFGKASSALAFFLSCVAVCAVSGITPENTAVMAEAAVSGILFVFLAFKFNSKFETLLAPNVTSPVIESVRTDIVRRLKTASEASSEICASLNDVNDVMIRADKHGVESVGKKTRERVCGSCGLYDNCWNELFENTRDCFNTLISLKREGVFLEYKTVPVHFASRCIRTETVCDCFNKLYTEYRARERVELRVREIYSLASEQFINVSSLLDSMCRRVGEQVCFDMDTASRARAAASSLGFETADGCCVIDSNDRLRLELRFKRRIDGDVKTLNLLQKQMESVCGRKLEYPSVVRNGNETLLTYGEKPCYRVVSSSCRSCSNGEKHSGDSYTTFRDDDGCFYAVICDGMGTGAKAAVSSGLAVTLLEKLIKAGFGVKAAIDTVNTSLISHSGDECSVTLDLTVIDLFTGGIEFYKCGAPETLIKKSSKVISIGGVSMPMGILSSTESAWSSGTVTDGDIVLMSSDGVREEDKPFVRSELKNFGGGSVRDFTAQLCELVRHYQLERNDDMTVITLAVTEND